MKALTPTASNKLSPADVAAHKAGSHVRRPAVVSQETPTPPSAPAARRRFVQQRGW
ncbi:hypothetical protein ACFYX8_35355 [Streptomyces cyaneofuscatus]|uniref:hypothetical protein n=1 Tax=Streptomyces cyaneofuscatus TaxID=66883 RepID=UPI003684237E